MLSHIILQLQFYHQVKSNQLLVNFQQIKHRLLPLGTFYISQILLVPFLLIICRSLYCHVVNQGFIFIILKAWLLKSFTIREFCYFLICIHLEMTQYPATVTKSCQVDQSSRLWQNFLLC